MEYILKVVVALKEGIFDPQGEGIRKTLVDMGFLQAKSVRMQKHAEILLEAASMEDALRTGLLITEKVLVNPVLETYSYTLEQKEGSDR